MIKTQFSKQEIEKILSQYNIGKIISFKPFKEGCVQTNILIITDKDKYVLRYYETRSTKYALFELSVLEYLHKHKYPCAMPIMNKEGQLLGEYNNKHYALFEYIKGKHIKKLNSTQKSEMIKYLAQLHNISRGYKPKYYEYRESHDAEYCINTSKKESKKFNDKKIAKARLKYLYQELKQLEFPKTIPKGVVHCDYDISNMKFVGNKLEGVLDFDDACYTYLIYDVASVIYYRCWIRERNKKLNFKESRNLIKIYDKYRKLSVTEKEHIYDALKMIVLTYAAWFFHDKWKKTDVFLQSQQRMGQLNTVGRKEFYKKLFV